MKKLKTLMIAALVVTACGCSEKPVANYTLISGKIDHLDGRKIQIMGSDRYSLAVDAAEDGTFADTIKIEGESYLVIGKEATKIYPVNGAVLNITADAGDFPKSVQISGEKAEMSNYFVRKFVIDRENNKNRQQQYTQNESDFLESVKKQMAAMEAELEKIKDIPESLRELEKKSIKAAYLLSLNYYPMYYPRYAQKEDYKPSAEFVAAMGDFDSNDGALFEYSSDYKSLIQTNCYSKAEKLVAEGKATSTELASIMVAEGIQNDVIRENLLFNTVNQGLSYAENSKELYDKYMSLAKNEKQKEKITKKYNQISKLDKGNPSPKFVGYENNAGGTSSLDDFKGKYVYIDVWATWCGPCKGEIPYLKTVEEKYHGKNIVFVSISVDKENAKADWKKMIAEKEMKGVQLIANDKQFADDYVIDGIPRFILIDPQGNIVSKDAPRPSDEKLIALFAGLGL